MSCDVPAGTEHEVRGRCGTKTPLLDIVRSALKNANQSIDRRSSINLRCSRDSLSHQDHLEGFAVWSALVAALSLRWSSTSSADHF